MIRTIRTWWRWRRRRERAVRLRGQVRIRPGDILTSSDCSGLDQPIVWLSLTFTGATDRQIHRLTRYIAGNPPFAALKGGVRSKMRRGDE